MKNLNTGKLLFFPFLLFHGQACLRNIAGQGKHHGYGVLSRGNRITAGSIHNNDTLFARGIQIHIIDADPGPSDNFKLFRMQENILCHLGRTSYDQSVTILYIFQKLFMFQFCLDDYLQILLFFQNLNPFFRQIVAYKDFHFLPPNLSKPVVRPQHPFPEEHHNRAF